jgi:hypothetical protein
LFESHFTEIESENWGTFPNAKKSFGRNDDEIFHVVYEERPDRLTIHFKPDDGRYSDSIMIDDAKEFIQKLNEMLKNK